MMKNAFYFILKALLIVRFLNFCPQFLGHVEKELDKKAKVNFKIYDIITSLSKQLQYKYCLTSKKLKAIR